MRRVIVVDASLPLRVGIASLLHDHGIAEVVGTFDHTEALAWSGDWLRVDALVVGVIDLARTGDQFPGPQVAARLRRHRPFGTAVITALASDPLDERVLRRMWEVDTDSLIGHAELCDTGVLNRLVAASPARQGIDPPRSTEATRMLGIERSSRINRFVERAEQLGTEYLSHEAPDGAPPLRSRWWLNLRRDLTEAGRLRVVNRDGSSPERNQRVASLAQLRRVHEWATRV